MPAGAGTVSVDVYDAGLYDRGSNEQIETGRPRATAPAGDHDHVERVRAPTRPSSTTATPPRSPSHVRGAASGRFVIAEEADPATYKNQWAHALHGIDQRRAGPLLAAGEDDRTRRRREPLRAAGHLDGTGKATLSAYRDMSMFNNQLTVNPNFYLAKVDPIHKGKTFLVSLYDPGEINVTDAPDAGARPDGRGGRRAAR